MHWLESPGNYFRSIRVARRRNAVHLTSGENHGTKSILCGEGSRGKKSSEGDEERFREDLTAVG